MNFGLAMRAFDATLTKQMSLLNISKQKMEFILLNTKKKYDENFSNSNCSI
jgi:hypothetical protein